jgi:hypothetical protein
VTGAGFELAGDDAGNYALVSSTLTAKANITAKALTGSFTATNKVYDGTRDASITGRSVDGVLDDEQVSLSGGTAQFETKHVGTDKTVTGNGFALAGDDAGNYELTGVAATKADITERDLTVTATGVNKSYDGGTAATVDLAANKVSGDSVASAYESASFDTKNVGTGKTVSVSGISITGADAGNYKLVNTTATTTAAITRKSLAGSFTANDKPYDGTRTASVRSRALTGVVGTEDVTLVVTDPLFDSARVGSDKDVTGALSLSGADTGNYSVNPSHTTKASITAWNASGHGFYQPVGVANSTFIAAGSSSMLPSAGAATVWNVAKGGSTIPLKFNVFAGTVEKTSTSDVKEFSAAKLGACASGTGEEPVEFVTSGSTALRYDATERLFIQNWKTPSVTADACYRATATFADGSTLSAFFKLRK